MEIINLVPELKYEVYDYLTETWNSDYEYLGYDMIIRRCFFRFQEQYDSNLGQTYMFISLDPEDIKHRVRL